MLKGHSLGFRNPSCKKIRNAIFKVSLPAYDSFHSKSTKGKIRDGKIIPYHSSTIQLGKSC